MPSNTRAQRWCFTLNNYTNGEKQLLADLCDSDHVKYGILGYERGDNDTPHIQGFVIFNDQLRFNTAKSRLGPRVHLEAARGTSAQAADYCKKDSDYDEFGSLPSSAGKRTDWERLKDWCDERTTIPSDYELFDAFPSLYGRYKNSVREICRLRITVTPRGDGTLREWQRDLESELDREPDDRKVTFLVDREGNSGKTWFVRYYCEKNPMKTQRMKSAKRDDMALALKSGMRVYFIDVPRGGMEHFQYSITEMIKDRAVFSPKYESCMKEWDNNSHVVIMCNEAPSMDALSMDRYNIKYTHNYSFNFGG